MHFISFWRHGASPVALLEAVVQQLEIGEKARFTISRKAMMMMMMILGPEKNYCTTQLVMVIYSFGITWNPVICQNPLFAVV